jgi:tRNA dimethylallyltransferase
MTDKKEVLCLLGPTAIGKSALALTLAQDYPIEIISVDSAMVYRGLDIGTAKPSIAERQMVAHHLIDIREPWQPYSVGLFVEDALRCIREVFNRGKVPLLVGGTMMYLHALRSGLAQLPATSAQARTYWSQRRQKEGLAVLWHILCTVDPEYAATIKAKDGQRIERALAVYTQSDKPMSQWLDEDRQRRLARANEYHFKGVALHCERAVLLVRIESRVRSMVAQGLLQEAAWLLQMKEVPMIASRLIGYQQALAYLSGSLPDEHAMIEAIVIATRQLAKRQMTWLRAWKGLTWVNAQRFPEEVARVVGQCLPS